MRPVSTMLVAVTITRSGIECRDVLRSSRSSEVEIDGSVYVDCGGNYVCGFYGTVQNEGKIIGFEINVFHENRPAWLVLKTFEGVDFIDDGHVRIIWGEVRSGEIVAGHEEWFQRCALLQAGPDAYCVMLDIPPTASEHLVCKGPV